MKAFSTIQIWAMSCLAILTAWTSHAQQPSFLTNGLVAHYTFNGNANDESGNGNRGTLNGATAALDRFGKSGALGFDGVSQFASLPIASILSNASQVTISMWVNDASAEQTGSIFGSWNESTGGIYINDFEGSNVGIALLPNGQINTAADTLVGKWKLVTLVYNGARNDNTQRLMVYLDGTPIYISLKYNIPITLSSGASSVLIGARQIGGAEGDFFSGQVDDVRIYNRALSDGEVKALYNYESIPPQNTPNPSLALATVQVVNGFVVGATITDAGYGYVSNPAVTITGGGGTGATAVAAIDANGTVTSIKILTTGSGYTSTPTITIEPPPFPPAQAKGSAAIINGFVTGVTITDSGRGYESAAPPVTFLGGGGSGAKGTAIVSNGIVTGISMIATGSGYTNAPYVLIAAPPGVPRLGIEVSQVRVLLTLIPGYTYKLQTATDGGIAWTDVGSSFLATESSMVQTFDVTGRVQIFRVVQVN